MADILLEKMFEKERWEYALEKGVGKKIAKAELIKLMDPMERAALYLAIKDGTYRILPPHTQLIPKDEPGEFREVLICEDMDRIILSIINDLFFEMFPEFVHKSCKSYQHGIGIGMVVKMVSKIIVTISRKECGKKYDMRKFFDTCKPELINGLFDKMELKYGKSKVIDLVRAFYNSNWLFNTDGQLVEEFKSIKQGTATSSFIADAILYEVDKELSEMKGIYYWRYSDDILILSNHWEAADILLKERLEERSLAINPKKEQIIKKNEAFKFLGFSIRGSEISLSKSRIKSFQKEIESRTIKSKKKNVVHDVCKFLYGDSKMKFSWATSVLPVINVKEDIETLNEFVMDSIRASMTGKKKIGGLGYEVSKKSGVITRGVGKNVTSNKQKTAKEIDGYRTLSCMQNALRTDRDLYDSLVRAM